MHFPKNTYLPQLRIAVTPLIFNAAKCFKSLELSIMHVVYIPVLKFLKQIKLAMF